MKLSCLLIGVIDANSSSWFAWQGTFWETFVIRSREVRTSNRRSLFWPGLSREIDFRSGFFGQVCGTEFRSEFFSPVRKISSTDWVPITKNCKVQRTGPSYSVLTSAPRTGPRYLVQKISTNQYCWWFQGTF